MPPSRRPPAIAAECPNGVPAKKEFLLMLPGDVYQTNADTAKLEAECGYKPYWSLHDGIAEFMKWYKSDKNPLR